MNTVYQNLSIINSFAKHRRMFHAAGAWIDYQRSLKTKQVHLNHYPPALMIEPTNICNLKCPLCPSGNGSLKRQRGMMSLAQFCNVVDLIYKNIGMLILWNQGEPYLNKDFNDMVHYASSKSLYTMTSTNASLDLDAEAIVHSGLNKLIISMDGLSEKTYNQYRVNGDYQIVLKNMEALVSAKTKLKSKSPYLVWQFIIMRQNEHEIPRVKSMARQIGIDKLEFKTVQIYKEEDLIFLPVNHEFSRYHIQGNKFELKTELLNRCRRLWTQPVINWDLELSICCYDKDLQYRIGNILEHGFYQLWTSSVMNRFRTEILNNRSQFEICRNCGEGIVQKVKL